VNGSPTTRASDGRVTALVIPPGTSDPIALVVLEDSTAAIAEAVGAGRVDDEQVTASTGIPLAIHLDDQASADAGSAGNDRAAAVLARLGVERREVLARLHGAPS
jgi:hypothetical protein